MALYAAPEMSAAYVLVSPSGFRVAFNDQTDPDYVGPLTDHSGFDSPEVREESENRPGTDGGLHGVFLFGRRPMTLTGMILNPVTTIDRATRIQKLQAAVLDCVHATGTLTWTLSTGLQLYSRVRCQQPLRVQGAWQKEFQIGFVAADPFFYSTSALATNEVSYLGTAPWGYPDSRIFDGGKGDKVGATFPTPFPTSFNNGEDALAAVLPTLSLGTVKFSTVATNSGSTATFPVITIQDQTNLGINNTPIIIQNATSKKTLAVYTQLSDGDRLIVDMKNKTITKNGISVYGNVDTQNTDWWSLVPGDNRILVATAAGNPSNNASSMQITWQNAWI